VTSARHKNVYFVIEGLNALATTYYGYYLFFFLKKVFGFDDFHNLAVGALFGLVFMVAAWFGGRFAQKFGYFKALKTGFVIMSAGPSACASPGPPWKEWSAKTNPPGASKN
jgi:MFS family permease